MSKNRGSQFRYTDPNKSGTIGDAVPPDILVGKTAGQVYVDELPEIVVDKKPYEEKIGIVNTTILNIRSHPVIDPTNIIGTMPCGKEMLIKNESGNFYEIITKDGDCGYCMKEFIRIRGEGVG